MLPPDALVFLRIFVVAGFVSWAAQVAAKTALALI